MKMTNAAIDKIIKFHINKIKFYREMKRLNSYSPFPKSYRTKSRTNNLKSYYR